MRKKLQKLTAIILSLAITVSVLAVAPFTVGAYANIDGYPDFDVDAYVAGLMTDSDNPLCKTINDQISLDSPNDVVIKQLKDDSVFQASYAGWKLAAFSGGDAVSDSLTEVGYYQSLILNVISEALTSSPVEDIFDNAIVKDAKHLQSTFTNTLKLDFVFTDLNDLNIAEMSQDKQMKVMEAFSSSFEKTYPKVKDVDKFVGVFNVIVKEGKNIETAINNLVAYCESVGMTEHMKAVVADLYKNCDSSNVVMKSALFEINKACQSYTLAYSAALFDLAGSSLTLLCGEVVDTMVDGIMAANPAGLSVMIGQAIGKGVANFLFSTDEICEQYHKMCCLYEFEELLGKVTKLEMNSFSGSKTNYNANKIFSAVDFLYKEYEVSCDLAKKYADIIFKESIAGIFILNSDGYNNYISSVEGMSSTAKSNYNFLKGDAWTYFLEEDYPDIYSALIKEDDEIKNPYVPVTGIAFEKSSVEWGTKDSFLNYDKATITPSNASSQSIEYTSSDPSVVSYNKFGAVVHKAGTATITATSVSSGLTATLNVTVVNGYGADGIALEDPNPDDKINIGDRFTVGNIIYEVTSENTVEVYNVYDNKSIIGEIMIPETISYKNKLFSVTCIGSCAFQNCSSLESITIPHSVTGIGFSAFEDCYSLKSITIPDSVMSIGDSAFECCSSLENITIPDGVTSIEGGTFRYCSSLENITIPDNVTNIGDYAFQYCRSLRSIKIPAGVTEIEAWTFGYCDNLQSITIPKGLIAIGEWAFGYCYNLGSIKIPDNLLTIGRFAFYSCTSLQSIIIPASVMNIERYAFQCCTSLKSATIGNGVIIIEDGAFDFCSNLEGVTIGNGVTNIGERAFYECTSLQSITIPESVEYIGDYALGYYYDDGYEKLDGFTIYGYKDTAAEQYATENGFEFVSLGYIKNDTETNIFVTIKNEAELSVEKLTDNESISKANAVLDSNEKLDSLFDISLTKDGTAVQPDGTATVKIPTDNENAKVYRIENNGTKTDMNAVYSDGYMVFTTEHFSLYALVVPRDTVVITGDVDGNDTIDVSDATAIQKMVAGSITFTPDQMSVADVNNDGEVSVIDVTLIQKYAAGVITEF